METENDLYQKIYRLLKSEDMSSIRALMLDERTNRLNPAYRVDANHSWYILGDTYWREARYKEALVMFRKAHQAWAEDWQTLMAIGNCYSELNRPKMAERYFRDLLEIRPDNEAAQFNLGNALYDQKKFGEATEIYKKLVVEGSELREKALKNIALCEEGLRSGDRKVYDE